MSLNEYRVKVTVRNNLLLSAIESAGYVSQAEFARSAEIHHGDLSALIAMREPPIKKSGEFSETAKAVMEALGAAPTDLWTPKQLTMALRRNSGERAISEAQFNRLLEDHQEAMMLPSPEDVCFDTERADLVGAAIDGLLTERQAEVLKKRFGLDGGGEKTLDEVGAQIDVGRERARQIQEKALRALRRSIPKETAELMSGLDCV